MSREQRQEAPHPNATTFDPAARYIATAELGIGPQARQVSEVAMEPGAGPRRVAFSPDGTMLYVINQLNATIAALPYHPDSGKLGGKPWTKGAVYKVLANRVYLGEALDKGVAYPGEHAAIIDQRIWNKAHRVHPLASGGAPSGARRLARGVGSIPARAGEPRRSRPRRP